MRLAVLIVLLLGVLAHRAAAADDPCAGFPTSVMLPASELRLCWRAESGFVDAVLIHPGRVWIGFGIGETMTGSDVVIGRPEVGSVTAAIIGGLSPDMIRSYVAPALSGTIVVTQGQTVLRFRRSLAAMSPEGRAWSASSASMVLPVVWAVGQGPGFVGHVVRGVALLSGAQVEAGGISPLLIWHGAILALLWAVVAPVCVLVARFYKVTPRQDFPRVLDNVFWWRVHVGGQMVVVLGGTGAFGLAWLALGGIRADAWHAALGFGVLALGWIQIVQGLLRGTKGGPTDARAAADSPVTWRGDHYDMTVRRRVFEWAHKSSGYIGLAIATGAIWTGIGFLDHSGSWPSLLRALLGTFVLAYGVAFWRLTRHGRRVDTYHAIWGQDSVHPGNQRRR